MKEHFSSTTSILLMFKMQYLSWDIELRRGRSMFANVFILEINCHEHHSDLKGPRRVSLPDSFECYLAIEGKDDIRNAGESHLSTLFKEAQPH